MDSIELKVDNHKYFLNDKEIPSVTKIISVITPDKFKYVDKDYLEYKSNLGTNIHKGIEEYDKGEYFDLLYDNIERNYIKQYINFITNRKHVPVYNEVSLYDSKLKYAGTIDKICDLNGKLALIDIKTGSYYKTHLLQVAAYWNLVKKTLKTKVIDCYLLYLTENSYELLKVNQLKEYFNVFKSIIPIYNFFNRRIKNERQKISNI